MHPQQYDFGELSERNRVKSPRPSPASHRLKEIIKGPTKTQERTSSLAQVRLAFQQGFKCKLKSNFSPEVQMPSKLKDTRQQDKIFETARDEFLAQGSDPEPEDLSESEFQSQRTILTSMSQLLAALKGVRKFVTDGHEYTLRIEAAEFDKQMSLASQSTTNPEQQPQVRAMPQGPALELVGDTNAELASFRRPKPRVNVNFYYDASRYADKSFIQEGRSQVEEAKTVSKSSKKPKLTVNLGFKYNAARYTDKSFINQNQNKDASVAKEETKTAKPKKVKVQLGFVYDSAKYQDKSFLPEQTNKASPPAPAPPLKRKKVALQLGFRYDASRYEDKSFLPENQSSQAHDQQALAKVKQTNKSSSAKKVQLRVDTGFKFDPSRYLDKRFLNEKDPSQKPSQVLKALPEAKKQDSCDLQAFLDQLETDEQQAVEFSPPKLVESSLSQAAPAMAKKPFSMAAHLNAINKLKSQEERQAEVRAQLAEEERKRQKRLQNKNRVDMVFLHASPNVYKLTPTDGSAEAPQIQQKMDALDFLQEAETIKQGLRETNRKILFEQRVATKANFEEVLRKQPRVLHISCHGCKGSVQQTRQMSLAGQQSPEQVQFLIFENETGDAQPVSAANIGNFMRQSGQELDLVFIAACDSQEIGHVFQRNGARHVICVKSQRYVLDQAAIQFTKTFYSMVMSGNDICSAFSTAKRGTGFKIATTEANLFVLLLAEDVGVRQDQLYSPGTRSRKATKHHECYPLPDFEEGHYHCLSEHTLIKSLPAKLDKFRFREKTMSSVLERIIGEKERILLLLGAQGIGKSSLARNTMHYVRERKLFTGGVILVQLKSVRNVFALLKLVVGDVQKCLDLSAKERAEFLLQTQTEIGMLDYLIELFNDERREPLRKADKLAMIKKRQPRRYLLCLDNATMIIEHELEEFQTILVELFDRCPLLSVLVTANKNFELGPGACTTLKPFLVDRLSVRDSVQLFQEFLGDVVTDNELVDLVLADSNYPFKEVLSNWQGPDRTDGQEASPELRKAVLQKVRQDWFKVLYKHELFRKHMQGNPTSITMLASLRFNPSAGARSLLDLYQNVQEQVDRIGQALSEAQPAKSKKPFKPNNVLALKISLQMNIRTLEAVYPDSVNLLYLLGNLPGGCTKDQLKRMWHGSNLDSSLEHIQSMQFFEAGVSRLVLTPTFLEHFSSFCDPASTKSVISQLCIYFRNLLNDCIKTLKKVPFFEEGLLNAGNAYKKHQRAKEALEEERVATKNSSQVLSEASADDELALQLRNVEHCVYFLIDLASSNGVQPQLSRINTNIGFKQPIWAETLQPFEETKRPETTGAGAGATNDTVESDDQAMNSLQSAGELTRTQTRIVVQQNYKKRMTFVRQLSELRTQKHDKKNQSLTTLDTFAKDKFNQLKKKSFFFAPDLPVRERTNQEIKCVDLSFESASSSASVGSQNGIKIETLDALAEQKEPQVPDEIHMRLQSHKKASHWVNSIAEESDSAHEQSFVSQKSKGSLLGAGAGAELLESEDVNQNPGIQLNFGNFSDDSITSESDLSSDLSSSQSENASNLSQIQEEADGDGDGAEIQEQPSNSILKHKSQGPAAASEKPYNPLQNALEKIRRIRINSLQARKAATGSLAKKTVMQLLSNVQRQPTKTAATESMTAKEQSKFKKLLKEGTMAERLASNLQGTFQRKVSSLQLAEQVSNQPDQEQSILDKAEADHERDLQEGHLWVRMTTEGSFILLVAVKSFLTDDFEFTLRVATIDFSYIVNTALFEGNILRLRALASTRLFEQALFMYEKSNNQVHDEWTLEQQEKQLSDSFNLLKSAIASLHNARDIYEAKQEGDPQRHGLGLTLYTLGYIYVVYASELSSTSQIGRLCPPEHAHYLEPEEQTCHKKALGYFREAFGHFMAVEHLLGLAMCKVHESQLAYLETNLPNSAHGSQSTQERLVQQARSLELKYRDYCESEGLEASCHVPREHGPDVSLMIEVVDRQLSEGQICFPLKQGKNHVFDQVL